MRVRDGGAEIEGGEEITKEEEKKGKRRKVGGGTNRKTELGIDGVRGLGTSCARGSAEVEIGDAESLGVSSAHFE